MKDNLYYTVTMVAGNSGDGIQALGHQLSYAHSRYGHIVQTLGEFPAEIRAPAGTMAGVSGFSVAFSSSEKLSMVPKYLDIAIVLNPAAYLVIKKRCTSKTLVLYDESSWTSRDLKKAKITSDPLADHQGRKVPLNFSALLQGSGEVSAPALLRHKNIAALGLLLWLHTLPLEPTVETLSYQFSKKLSPLDFQAMLIALKAGYYYGETLELGWSLEPFGLAVRPRATAQEYIQLSGHQSLVLGMLYCAEKFQKKVLLTGYPITPASELLHIGHRWQSSSFMVYQAEDEIAAAGVALGAAYGGSLALTCTSGPGFDLKAEMMGLGVMSETPFVIINIQRGGPSTGLPTKVEQSDFAAALGGRHGDCPIPILAHHGPEDGIKVIERAFDWAIKAMTPVIVLSDALVALKTAPLAVKDYQVMTQAQIEHHSDPQHRGASGERGWAIPSPATQTYCLGGLERDRFSGKISYEAQNHEIMTQLRADKIQSLAEPAVPPLAPQRKRYLWVAYGSAASAVKHFHGEHHFEDSTYWILSDLFPLPQNFWTVAQEYNSLIVAELSMGQFAGYLKSFERHHDIASYTQVNGEALDIERLASWFNTLRSRDHE